MPAHRRFDKGGLNPQIAPMQKPARAAQRETFDRIMMLIQAGELETARRLLDKLRKPAPNDVNLLNLAAFLAGQRGDHRDAMALYKQVLAQAPDQPQIRFNLHRAEAIAAEREGDLPAALEALHRAAQLAPQDEQVQAQAALIERQLGLFSAPPAWRGTLNPAAAMVLLDDPEAQHANAQAWARRQFGSIAPLPLAPARESRAPLRLGFLGCDFHDHATAYLMAELFALLDSRRYEPWIYSYGSDDGSAVRRRIATTVPQFHAVQGQTAEAIARRIREDAIDVLIDLKGYTRGGRLDIPAYRPAPLQMHWLGFPGTLGCSFIDYFIADPVALPPALEPHFSEKILRLPGSYQCNDRQRPLPPPLPRASHGLPESAVIFASLNQTYKLHPALLQLWARILRDVPDSILWLLAGNAWAPENIRAFFAAEGIAPERLHFAAPASQFEHLQRYHAVDVALDTFPIGGHTTTSDALWLGAPVVTLAGESFVSRVAASLLTATGQAALIAATPENYHDLATRLGREPARRQAIRRHLTENRLRLPLFDGESFVKNLMLGLDLAWARHRQGLPPAALHVG